MKGAEGHYRRFKDILSYACSFTCGFLFDLLLSNQDFLLFSIMQKIIKKYNLREKVQGQHQTYALGIKEVFFSSLVNLLRCVLHFFLNLFFAIGAGDHVGPELICHSPALF